MFNGSPVKRLLLNAEGSFIEERIIDMQNDGALYVHSAHVDAAQQSVQRTAEPVRKTKARGATRRQ